MPTDQELIKIVPSKRQLKYQETEFYAFFHFGIIRTRTGNGETVRKIPGFLIRRNLMPVNGYRQ